jgi:hypothetical protein
MQRDSRHIPEQLELITTSVRSERSDIPQVSDGLDGRAEDESR